MIEKVKKNWKIIAVFVVGLMIAIYPIISNRYYTIKNNNDIAVFEKATEEVSQEEIDKRIDLAKAYNETLDPSRLADPYTEREKEGVANYARMLEVKEQIGFVDIPQIDQKIPVYAGTSEDVLQKACGHLEGTSLPIGGIDTHAVITAHRGLPQVKLFRELDKLKVGDVFYFTNIQETLAYEVDQILTVEPWDFDPVLVVEGQDLMTLLTCTPYMINSHRLLVRGHRVPYVAEKASEDAIRTAIFSLKDMIWPIVIAIVILLAVWIVKRIRRRRNGKKS